VGIEERLEAIRERALSIASMIQDFDVDKKRLVEDLLEYIEGDAESIVKDINDLWEIALKDK